MTVFSHREKMAPCRYIISAARWLDMGGRALGSAAAPCNGRAARRSRAPRFITRTLCNRFARKVTTGRLPQVLKTLAASALSWVLDL